MQLMQALVYEGPAEMRPRAVAVPVPGPHEVLVSVHYSGICGSELSGYLGHSSIRRPPLVFGHEFSGYVAAVGDGVAESIRPGARVTANPLTSCGSCARCREGRENLCPHRTLLGASRAGCNAEFVVVAAQNAVVLPVELDLRDAALAEPVACALHAVRLSGVGPGDSALVIGAGPIGLLLIQALRVRGVETVLVVERNADRLALAVALGASPLAAEADFAQLTVDAAFDAVGSEQTRRGSLAALRAGGRCVFIGLHAEESTLAVNALVRSETTLIGAFAYTHGDFHEAVRLLATGEIGLRDGVVVAPLEAGAAWFERLIAGDSAAKVLLTPSRGASSA